MEYCMSYRLCHTVTESMYTNRQYPLGSIQRSSLGKWSDEDIVHR